MEKKALCRTSSQKKNRFKMAFHYLLLLLPALSLARIDVKIQGDFSEIDKTVNIEFTGTDKNVLSETERKTFDLDEDTLMMNTLKFFGKRPDNVYIRSPTPFGDLYKTYNWEEVVRTLTPMQGRVLNITSETITVASQNFENNDSKPKTFNLGLTKHLENTVSSLWTKDGDLTVNNGINYSIRLGNATISYTSLWGLNTEKSTTMLMGSNDMQLILLPGQKVTTELLATKFTITLEMEYTATIAGTVAVNYKDSFKDHHFWALDVDEMMSDSGMASTAKSKETIDIVFHMNPDIVVFDTMTREPMTDLIM
ncbi:spherulin-2A-like [Battus philenor]|uniref:spherulin-2A-like n=1 Tax=Battus philenor TaxID=42288 RepID=UPI0035CFE1A8